jgi:hypothetical protein
LVRSKESLIYLPLYIYYRERKNSRSALICAQNKNIAMEDTMAKNKSQMQSLKMQAANEVNVPLNQTGDNGHLTARQAGSIGGQMVRKMIEQYERGR